MARASLKKHPATPWFPETQLAALGAKSRAVAEPLLGTLGKAHALHASRPRRPRSLPQSGCVDHRLGIAQHGRDMARPKADFTAVRSFHESPMAYGLTMPEISFACGSARGSGRLHPLLENWRTVSCEWRLSASALEQKGSSRERLQPPAGLAEGVSACAAVCQCLQSDLQFVQSFVASCSIPNHLGYPRDFVLTSFADRKG